MITQVIAGLTDNTGAIISEISNSSLMILRLCEVIAARLILIFTYGKSSRTLDTKYPLNDLNTILFIM